MTVERPAVMATHQVQWPRRTATLRPRPVKAAALLVALALAVPAEAPAQGSDRQSYSATLTSTLPRSPTGLDQEIHYVNPDDPEGKPYSVQRVVFRLPEGALIDTSVPARCAANEAEFQLRGAAACPPETQVGTGALSADAGAAAGPFPRVIETQVTFFNNEDELILFAETTNTPGRPIRVASRIEVQDRAFVSQVPPLPGAPPPDPFLALKDVVNRLRPIPAAGGAGTRGYLRTPSTCPASRRWVITATFTYRDGVEQTERSTTPCVPRTARHSPRDRPRGEPQDEDGGRQSPDGSREAQAATSGPAGAADPPVGDGSGGRLPFTGLPLAGMLLLGAALAAAGWALRR